MGGKGDSATNAINGNSGYNNLYNAPQYLADPKFQDLLSSYGSGKTSLADALSAAKGTDPTALRDKVSQDYNQMWAKNKDGGYGDLNTPQGQSAWQAAQQQVQNEQADLQKQDDAAKGGADRMNAIFTNPLTGTKAATDQVMNNDAFKPYADYGKGLIGQNDNVTGNLASDRDALMGKGETYGLTDNDLKAYGQASDNISRQYASSDQSLAQMLSDRGLSQAPSGAAVQAFSGQMGNKNEQLAQMQQQISQNRINTAQGLANDRMNADLSQQKTLQGSIQGMGSLTNQAVGDQFNRNLAGVNTYAQQNKDSLGAAQANQDQMNQGFSQQQATKGPGLGDILGAAGGIALGAATGGVGTGLGAALGQGLGSSINPSTVYKAK